MSYDLPFTELESQWKKDELKLALTEGYVAPAAEFRHNDPINLQKMDNIIGYLLGDKLSQESSWEFSYSNGITTWATEYVSGLVKQAY